MIQTAAQRSRPLRVRLAAAALAAGLGLCALSARADEARPEPEAAVSLGSAGQQAVLHALSLLGVRYKLGGNAPETGLDCSGLVRFVFNEVAGLSLPRRSADMSQAGQAIADPADLKPGDLVFFRNVGKLISHVGIYIGDNAFVHAASHRHAVRVDRIDEAHWRTRFVTARRVAPGEVGVEATLAPAVLREAPQASPGRSGGFVRPVAARARAAAAPRAHAAKVKVKVKVKGKPKAPSPAKRR
jgi:hypothetical protein